MNEMVIGVYGVDITKPIKLFETVNEAMEFAKKNLRNFGRGRMIKDRGES